MKTTKEVSPAYGPCAACGTPILRGVTPRGERVVVEVWVKTYIPVWANDTPEYVGKVSSRVTTSPGRRRQRHPGTRRSEPCGKRRHYALPRPPRSRTLVSRPGSARPVGSAMCRRSAPVRASMRRGRCVGSAAASCSGYPMPSWQERTVCHRC
jgi:hypothetical protein